MIAAYMLAERRILNEPSTIACYSGYEADEKSGEESDNWTNRWAARGAHVYNQFAGLKSNNESDISYAGSISRWIGLNSSVYSDHVSISDSGRLRPFQPCGIITQS